jgi:restriction system protein
MSEAIAARSNNVFVWTLGILFGLFAVAAYFIGARGLETYAIGFAICLFTSVGVQAQINAQVSMERKLQAAVTKHMDALVRQRQMLVRVDAYGNEVHDKWHKEVARFIDSVFLPELTVAERKQAQQTNAFNLILNTTLIQRVAAEAVRRSQSPIFTADMGGLAFEAYCSDLLRASGWQAYVTTASGDQGADVFAQKDGDRVVVQAKLHSAPVGNKAVQEAHSAKAHYRATAAVVVGQSGFTTSAQQLAGSTGVMLLHYSELGKLSSLLGVARSQGKHASPHPAAQIVK